MDTKAKYSHPEMKGGNCVFLLWLIGKHEAHGYQIIKLLKDEGMPIGANRLYPVLRNMLSDGVISQKEKRDGKRVRKEYAITQKGRNALKRGKRLFRGIAGKFAKEMLE